METNYAARGFLVTFWPTKSDKLKYCLLFDLGNKVFEKHFVPFCTPKKERKKGARDTGPPDFRAESFTMSGGNKYAAPVLLQPQMLGLDDVCL